MRRGRFVLGGALIVAALLVGGVWVASALLDWNRYRDEIAELASAQLGRPVHIGGAVSLQLLPQPILTASDITVDGVGDGSGGAPGPGTGPVGSLTLTARALRLRVALGALLAGQVNARELVLQGADLHLPWPPQGSLARRPPPWLTGLQARAEDSRLEVGGLVLTGIDATLATDPDTGTLAVAGTGRAGERSWQFTARLARPGGDGTAGLDVSLDGLEQMRDTGGSFSGQLGADGGLSGRVAGRGPDLSALLPAPGVPWRADGRLTAAGGLAVADQLVLEIGGMPARGTVALRVQPQGRLDLALTTGRLDLDAWLPAMLRRKGGTMRAGLATGIDLSAEAATFSGATVRQFRAGLDLTGDGRLTVRDVSGVLPGEARVGLRGVVTTDAAPPGPAGAAPVEGDSRFDGSVTLRAADLRELLRWAERALPGTRPALPDGALRTAEGTAHLVLGPGQVQLTGLTGTLDGGAVQGDIGLRAGKRWAMTAALGLDRVMLDPWVPSRSVLADPGTTSRLLTWLREMDLDVRLALTGAQWGGRPVGSLGLELQTDAVRVALRRFEARPAGAVVTASGQVGEGNRLTDGRFAATIDDLGSLRPLLAMLPEWAGWVKLFTGPGRLTLTAGGLADALQCRASLEMGDLRAEAQPVVNLPGRRLVGPMTLHHPGAPRLLDMLGLPGAAAWLGDGSFSLLGQVSARPGRVSLDGGRVAAGALQGGVQGWLEGRFITGQASFETLPLPALDVRATEPMPLGWLHAIGGAVHVDAAQVLVGLVPTLDGVVGDLALEGGVLNLSRVVAHASGGTLGGQVRLDGRAEPPVLRVQGQANGMGVAGALFGTVPDVASGQMDVGVDLSATGYSMRAMLATLGGTASVRVTDGVATGLDLAALSQALAMPDARQAMAGARQALLAGDTPFKTVEAPLTISGGTVAIEARLAGAAGSAALTGTVDLQDTREDLRLTVQPPVSGADGPILGLRLAGQPVRPARTPELSGLARWLADRPGP